MASPPVATRTIYTPLGKWLIVIGVLVIGLDVYNNLEDYNSAIIWLHKVEEHTR